MKQLHVQTDILDTHSYSWLYLLSIKTNGKASFYNKNLKSNL